MLALFHHVVAVLAVAWTYFCAHLAAPIGTVLAPMLISTLIAGHVNKGTAGDGKLVQLLKLFVRLCGWAVHYNEPGSVKLPGGEVLMLIWKGIVLVYRVFKPAPAALLALAALAVSGCSWEPIDAMTGLTIALIAGTGGLALLMARALTLRSAPLLVLIGILAFAPAAHATVPQFSMGPSVSFFRFGFKLVDPAHPAMGDKAGVDALAAGVGWSFHYNPPALTKGDVAYLSLTGTALAQLDTLPLSGGLAIAAGPSFYNGLVGLQVGYKLFDLSDGRPMEGLFAGGAGGRRNVFVLCNVSINLLLPSKLTTGAAVRGARAPQSTPPNYWHVGH